MVWKDNVSPTNSEIYLRKSTTGGSTFDNPIHLSNNLVSSSDPHIAVVGSNAYVIWDGIKTNQEIFFAKSTDGGNTFGNPINVSNNLGPSLSPQMVVSGSTVYVVWQDFPPTIGSTSDILFKRSINGGSTFGSAFNLSNNNGISLSPQMVVSGSTVYVVWQDDTPGNYDVLFRKSNAGTINLSNNTGGSFTPQIAVS